MNAENYEFKIGDKVRCQDFYNDWTNAKIIGKRTVYSVRYYSQFCETDVDINKSPYELKLISPAETSLTNQTSVTSIGSVTTS